MRGSPTRIRLLNAINNSSKNKLQLAKELGVDWKTIDNPIVMLLQSRLVEEKTVVGTSKYYAITHNGAKVLSLLSDDQTTDRDHAK
jgi:predicted transcriptional regulator